jgi:hypothetical protein
MHIRQSYILITGLNWIIRKHWYMPDVNIRIKLIHWYVPDVEIGMKLGTRLILHEVPTLYQAVLPQVIVAW